jgi:hypothetical protein
MAVVTTEIRCERIGGVSDFFDVPALPELPPEPRYRMPAWLGPRRGELPGVVPFELVLARTERVAVCLAGLRAYTTGFLIDLLTMTAEEDEELDPGLFAHPRGHRAQALRFGIELSDGRRATNVGCRSEACRIGLKGQCSHRAGAGAAGATGARRGGPGRFPRPARSRSSAPGRRRGSSSRGPRSTRGRSSTPQRVRR